MILRLAKYACVTQQLKYKRGVNKKINQGLHEVIKMGEILIRYVRPILFACFVTDILQGFSLFWVRFKKDDP